MYTEINECGDNERRCDRNAQCINLDGSFSCVCNEGYTQDGVFCDGELKYLWIPVTNLQLSPIVMCFVTVKDNCNCDTCNPDGSQFRVRAYPHSTVHGNIYLCP